MAGPRTLTDSELSTIKDNLAGLVNNPNELKAQLDSRRRVSVALSNLGFSTAKNADCQATLSLLATLDDMADGEIDLASQTVDASVPKTVAGAAKAYHLSLNFSASNVATFQMRMYDQQPNLVLSSLLKNAKIATSSDATSRDKVANALVQATPRFIIGRDPVETIINDSAISPTVNTDAAKALTRKLARLSVLVRLPQHINNLWTTSFESATSIAHTPRKSFVETMVATGVEEEYAVAIHEHAVMIDLRNEQAWSAMLASKSLWSPATMSASGAVSTGSAAAAAAVGLSDQLINYANLFGDIYVNPCEDCSSVTSPAAYFVDLLRMLKNCSSNPGTPNAPTLLAKLLERRPDLTRLQLSCANTNTLVPYIDLANEVMESFIDNMANASASAATISIASYNMNESDTSDQNTTQPRNTITNVYRDRLSPMVYPLNIFPYNQALDLLRTHLSALGSSKYEIMSTFQSKFRLAKDTGSTGTGMGNFKNADAAVRSAMAAEYLNLLPEDFVLITGKSVFPYSYFTGTGNSNITSQAAYDTAIKLKDITLRWGFAASGGTSADAMMSADGSGLPNVQKGFLPRANMLYGELLQLLKTRFLGGRLALRNTADAPIFNTDVADIRLAHPTATDSKGPLTRQDAEALNSFIRLWQKTPLSMSDLDLALSVLTDQQGANDTMPQIGPDAVQGLAAIQQLAVLTTENIETLMPLWGLMDTWNNDSLYAKLFLRGNLNTPDPVFGKDSTGKILNTFTAKLSDNRGALLGAMGIQDEFFDTLTSASGIQNNMLNLANITSIYRAHLFCRLANISPLDFPGFAAILKAAGTSPFKTPQATIEVLNQWWSCAAKGLSVKQLLYITGQDRALGISNPGFGVTTLDMANKVSTLVKGMKSIEQDFPVGTAITEVRASASEVVRIASLMFDLTSAPQVVDFVEGTATATAPQTETSPLYQNVLLPLWKAKEAEARTTFFQQTTPSGTADDVGVALEAQVVTRRLFFLRNVVPFVKSRLLNDLIVGVVASLLSDGDLSFARALASDLTLNTTSSGATSASSTLALLATVNQSTYNYSQSFLGQNTPVQAYFVPPATEVYRISFLDPTGTVKPTLYIDNVPVRFGDKSGQSWVSDELKLNLGQVYEVRCVDRSLANASYTTNRTTALPFNSDVLVYKETMALANQILLPLSRIAQCSQLFSLTAPEILFMSNQASGTSLGVNFNAITYEDVKMMQRYADIKSKVASNTISLLEYFQWIVSSDRSTSLAEKLSALTGIGRSQVQDYIDSKMPMVSASPDMGITAFSNDRELGSLLQAYELTSRLSVPGLGFKLLFKWAMPSPPDTPGPEYTHAAELRGLVQLLVSPGTGPNPVTAANDVLRVNQRKALITYLLQQSFTQSKGIVDSGKLFEYLLIDVEMNPGFQTSRLRQAITTVQFFVQRCLLGLEKPRGVNSGTVNMDRWAWMKDYRVWEANRKVYLYPENYLDPTLRDDKSEAFRTFESAMLQTDLTTSSITELIRAYIYSSNDVADLEIVAYSWERRSADNGLMHFFGRTRSAPYVYYYRPLELIQATRDILNWQPWSRMDVEISGIETDLETKPLAQPGVHLVSATKDRRLFLFMPQLTLKAVGSSPPPNKTFQQMSNEAPSTNQPARYWHLQMAYVEYLNGKWSPKQLSPNVMTFQGAVASDFAGQTSDASILTAAALFPTPDSLNFWVYSRSVTTEAGTSSNLAIIVDRTIKAGDNCARLVLGGFELSGTKLVLLDKSKITQSVPTTYNSSTQALPFNKWSAQYQWMNVYRPDAFDYSRYVRIGHRGNDSSYAYLGVVVFPYNTPAHTSKWTLSLDMTNFNAATGFIQEVTFQDKVTTWFTNVIPGGGTGGFTTGAQDYFQNMLSPLLMSATSKNGSLDEIYAVMSSVPTAIRENAFGRSGKWNELSVPYSLYTWEAAVHTVMLVVERLQDLQAFDLALRVARYIFDPTIDGSALNRCWKFFPFQDIASSPPQTTEALLKTLSASSGAESAMAPDVLEWRLNPFNPHVVARNRPVAYMKRIVMKYVELLLCAGDRYFTENTYESLPVALNYYVEADSILGPAPKPLPKIGRGQARTYADLDAMFNDFSNASYDMELDFPFYCDPAKRGGAVTSTSSSYGLSGMLRTTYFCVPTNPQLLSSRRLVDDRLFKIRNNLDISGNVQTISLFGSPMDPGSLVNSVGRGASVNVLLNDTVGPMPNFRFAALLEKALDLCSSLKDMGAAFLQVKETRDSEALAALQARQESTMQGIIIDMKKQAREEVLKSIEELEETRKGQVSRLRYYLALTGDSKPVPSKHDEWRDITQSIEKPSKDGLGTTSYERLELSKMGDAINLSRVVMSLNATAAIIRAIPDITMNIEPLGVGTTIGGITVNISDAIAMAGSAIQTKADISQIEGSQAARKAELISQMHERRMEANAAGRDIKVTDKQLATMQVRLKLCDEDIRQQKQLIAHTAEIAEWMRSKYTNVELYQWIEGQIRSLFYQTYLAANDLAKKAQKVYRFERRADANEYIGQGYWNSGRDGLMSGENLYLALKRMEGAYLASKGHDYEMTKKVSLRAVQPLALMALRETGVAEFTLPEVLFDYDFPGHYMRRIKTVNVSLPTSTDLGTTISATLRLLEHRYRISRVASSGSDYAIKSSDDDRFRTDQAPITAIAISTVLEDSGVFGYELEFNDYMRYVPFEGAGAISKWRLELPTAIKQFDYSLITDAVLNIQYTSLEGGAGFRKAASEAARSFQSSVTGLSTTEGLFGIIDVKNDYPSQWTTLTTNRSVVLSNLSSRLPFWVRGRTVKVETVTALINATATVAWATNLTVTGNATISWNAGPDFGSFKTVTKNALSERFTDWTVALTQQAGSAGLQNLIFVIRYYLA